MDTVKIFYKINILYHTELYDNHIIGNFSLWIPCLSIRNIRYSIASYNAMQFFCHMMYHMTQYNTVIYYHTLRYRVI